MESQINSQLNQQQAVIKAGLVLAGVLLLNKIFSEPKDTVNYTLYYKGKKVYHGISYEDCFQGRIDQHERTGIIKFDDCVYDYPKTRTAALALERKRINRDQTRYNVHHR
jgi:hypothetical protein